MSEPLVKIIKKDADLLSDENVLTSMLTDGASFVEFPKRMSFKLIQPTSLILMEVIYTG